MKQAKNVIIAGAGLAGLLSLRRLSKLKPDWTFTLLEREPWIGGRMRPMHESEGSWACGLQAGSARLLEYVMQADGELPENTQNILRPMATAAVLSAQKVLNLSFAQLVQVEFTKMIGGAAAAREWPKVEEFFAKAAAAKLDLEQTFSQAWTGDKKSAALVSFEHLAHIWGMPELGANRAQPFIQGWLNTQQGLWTGRWDLLFDDVLAELRGADRLQLVTRAQVMTARYTDNLWTLSTTKGVFSSQRLLVAHSPWEAILWLPKDLWPTRVINISSKTKPVSMVVLSARMENAQEESLPDIVIIPAEDTQVIKTEKQLCYQTPLAFELTVQAPAVVKAIKRLKRAKKKLESAIPEIAHEGEHIALLPVAWSHASIASEQKWFEKLDVDHVQAKHLGFAGDAIGSDADSDQNLIQSVEDACRVLSQI